MGVGTIDLNPDLHRTVLDVLTMVEDATGIPKDKIQGPSRNRHYVDAKKICANILRRRLNLTYYDIARYLKKDHATIMYYDKMHAVHITEPNYRKLYSTVSGMLAIKTTTESESILRAKLIELNYETEELLKTIRKQSKALGIINDT
jgi:hypothetical protein